MILCGLIEVFIVYFVVRGDMCFVDFIVWNMELILV